MKKIFSLRGLAFAVAALATAVAAFYIVENWRGEKAWSQAKATLRARGLPVTMDEWAPPAPPPEQNFMLAPVLLRLVEQHRHEATAWDFPPPRNGRPQGEWPWEATSSDWGVSPPDLRPVAHFLARQPGDPPIASQAEAATTILAELAPTETDFREMLAAARSRPSGMVPPDTSWTGSGLGIGLSHTLALRGWALAALGRADEALDCMEVMVRLSRGFMDADAQLVSRVLGMAIQSAIASFVGNPELLRGLSPAQLARADSLLTVAQGAPPLWRAMVTERLSVCSLLEKAVSTSDRDAADGFSAGATGPVGWPRVLHDAMPRGWVRQSQARIALTFADYADALKAPVFDERVQLPQGPHHSWKPYEIFAGMAFRGLSGVHAADHELTCWLRLARLALAALGHSRETGKPPEALGGLAGMLPAVQFTDTFTGESFRLTKTDDFLVLWSRGRGRDPRPGEAPDAGAGHIVVRVPVR